MKKITLLLLLSLCLTDSKLYSQSNIDRTYEFFDMNSNLIDNLPKVDYSVCKSNNNEFNYVAVTSFLKPCDGFQIYQIKVIEFDSSGNIVNESLLCSQAALHSIALDIKPLKNQMGYVICGYMDAMSANQPMHPIAIKIFNNFALDTQVTFSLNGMFSRVDENDNGEFVFCGFKGDSTDWVCNKEGLIIFTNSQFTVSNTFNIYESQIGPSVSNINDVKFVSQDDIIFSGNRLYSDTTIRLYLARFDLNNGNIIWEFNQFHKHFAGAKFTLNDNNIYLISNEYIQSSSVIYKFDIQGNYLGNRMFEMKEFEECTQQTALPHIPYSYNIKIIGFDSVFVSGKCLTGINAKANHYPFDVIIDLNGQNPSNWLFYNPHVYYTNYISPITDITGYYLNTTIYSGYGIAPSYSTNNSILLNNKIITTTYTNLGSFNPTDLYKTWTFTNTWNNVYGYRPVIIEDAGSLPDTSGIQDLNIYPINSTTLPYFLKNDSLTHLRIFCPRRGDCCN